MHVRVDSAGQRRQPARVDPLPGRQLERRTDLRNPAVGDRDVDRLWAVGRPRSGDQQVAVTHAATQEPLYTE